MKRVFTFFLGFITAILCLAIVGYILLKDNSTISLDNSSEKHTQSDLIVDSAIKISEISTKDFDSLKQNIHKRTLVNFWASWCRPCVDEIPILLEYGKKNNINLIFVSVDKNNEKQKELVRKQMDRLGLNNSYIIKNHNLMDVTGRSSYYDFLDRINVKYSKKETGIPFFVLIDEKGNYEKVFNGPNKFMLYSEYYNSNMQN